MDAELKELFKVVLDLQAGTAQSVTSLAEQSVKLAEQQIKLAEQQTATSKAIADLAVTVDKYVAASDARMVRLEENLDGLIRAITREHSNGKGGAK